MGEVVKLQNHLRLLREEYVKLQERHRELEKKYEVTQAMVGNVDGDTSFVAKLLRTVADLFDRDTYSDLVVRLNGHDLKAHRFVLAARSDYWGVDSLTNVTTLDFTGDIPFEVGHALMKWVYTDEIDIKAEEGFLLSLLRTSSKFRLKELSERCEKALVSSVNVRNCLWFFQTADEIGAETLKKHCSELISNHWNEFTPDDFVQMPAQLAYAMFKSKSEFPLHTAVKIKREDVVFLYLVEFSPYLPAKLNEIDNQDDLVLDLALKMKQESIALSLIDHNVNVDALDRSAYSLLHKAIKRGDEFSATFLIKQNANVNCVTPIEKQSPLHMTASFGPEMTDPATMEGMARVSQLLLDNGANCNTQDSSGNTAIHCAVGKMNEAVFSVLLKYGGMDLELRNSESKPVLSLALHKPDQGKEYSEISFASRLVKHGSSPSATDPFTGDSLLHQAARETMEEAGRFLAMNGAKINLMNNKGETALHTACLNGLTRLVEVLLQKGGNPNAQTTSSLGEEEITSQTPLHLAVSQGHKEIVELFLAHKGKVTTGGDNLMIIPNFTIKDSKGQTAMGLSLWKGLHSIAKELMQGGAGINDYHTDGTTLLHQAISKQDVVSSLFLLENHADPNSLTKDKRSCIELAIECHLPAVVDNLCVKGANINCWYSNGDSPLWHALNTGQEDIAEILVEQRCDTNMWGPGPNKCRQTLLHRAIDESNEPVACFLIKSGCDVNSPRKPGPNGEGDDEAKDLQGPLHLSCSWGLEKIVQCLVERNADVNAQDVEGKTALHIAITNQHPVIISLLLSSPSVNLSLSDKQGHTPFAAAMMTKNIKAAQSILDRSPSAAEQMDLKGRNFLHLAIQKSDIESVLFLISVNVDVNSQVRDSTHHTPLHLAVIVGSEMIVRNLILAGADKNSLTPKKQTALHLAALSDQSAICSVLLANDIQYDAQDDVGNSALHVATQQGHLASVRVLLTESSIYAESVNNKMQTPLHILGIYGKENGAAIFELFHNCMPNYPLDKPDAQGNTCLLLAYTNGNGNLCRALVRGGSSLGCMNKEGLSIFNAPVATRQLLFKLLDMLSSEPAWIDCETCLECGVKFGIKTRKHHCRHCGRVLCSKCSDKDIPIIKFNVSKPVRVCEVCFDVLTLGLPS